MINNYSTLNLLNFEDVNIFISNEPIQLVSFGSQSVKLVHAYLDQSFNSCPCCHTLNPKLHKHGSKTSNISPSFKVSLLAYFYSNASSTTRLLERYIDFSLQQ